MQDTSIKCRRANARQAVLALLAAFCMVNTAAAAAPTYSLRLLDEVPGKPYCSYSVINAQGETAAACRSATDYDRAVRWDAEGRVVWVEDTPGNTDSVVKRLNDQRLLLGTASSATSRFHGFLQDPAGGYRDMMNANGHLVSLARDLNQAGEVAISPQNRRGIHASVYTEEGGIHQLDPRLPAIFDHVAINDVGNSVLASPNAIFLYGTRDQAAQLPDTIFLGTVRLNNRQQVVGRASFRQADGRNPYHAFVWSKAKGMRDLGVLSPETLPNAESWAYDINDAGQVVGMSDGEGGGGFVWQPDTGMLRLTDLTDAAGLPAFEVAAAYGINRHGDIVAIIRWKDGVTPSRMGVLSRKKAERNPGEVR